jgi:hypothetical protein
MGSLNLFEGTGGILAQVFKGRKKCTSCWEVKSFYFPVCAACGRHDGSSVLMNLFFIAPISLVVLVPIFLALDLLLLPFRLLFASFRSGPTPASARPRANNDSHDEGDYERSRGEASGEDYGPRIRRVGALLEEGQYEAALLASKQGVMSGDTGNERYYIFYGQMAEALALLGRKEEALDAIEASIEWGCMNPDALTVGDHFNNIKGEPRFQIAVKTLEALSGS